MQVIMRVKTRPQYLNYRLTLDSKCNIVCGGKPGQLAGKSIFWTASASALERFASAPYATAIFVQDKARAQREGKKMNWYFVGTYRCKWMKEVEDDDYNNASAAGKEILVNAMMAYRGTATKRLCLDAWGFTDTRGMSTAEARLSIIEDFQQNLPQYLAFLYFEYAGVVEKDWEEIEVCSKFRDFVEANPGDTQGLMAMKKIVAKATERLVAELKRKKNEPIKVKEEVIS